MSILCQSGAARRNPELQTKTSATFQGRRGAAFHRVTQGDSNQVSRCYTAVAGEG